MADPKACLADTLLGNKMTVQKRRDPEDDTVLPPEGFGDMLRAVNPDRRMPSTSAKIPKPMKS